MAVVEEKVAVEESDMGQGESMVLVMEVVKEEVMAVAMVVEESMALAMEEEVVVGVVVAVV